MKSFGQLLRLFYINYVIARYGLDRIVLSAPMFSPVRFLSYFNPWNWFNKNKQKTRGESIRVILEELGPIFIKFGQILSTRYDLLPEDIIAELEKLQDQVPPFPAVEVQQILQQVYGARFNEIFAEFSTIPLASASIAQVHAAVLHNGKKVVVKIRRPQIEKTIQRDIGLLYMAAGFAEHFWSHGRRLRPKELVAEFERTIIDELDFMREAANASQLRRNFQHTTMLYVPEIFWDYTTVNVLVMEQISGIRISNVEALHALNVNMKKLAEHGVEIFFTQVFRDNFFHADMHPGNVFVEASHPQDPQYIAIDFGIMGSLSPDDQHYLAENLLAFFKRDYRRVAVLHVESGWVPPNTRVEEFEAAIRTVCEPIFEKPLREISFGQLLLRLFQTASRFKMEVQPQLFLLQKTLLNIEALGSRLYPDLDLWATGKPFLERWIKRRYSVRATMKNIAYQLPRITDSLIALPGLCESYLQHQHKLQAMEVWQSRGPTTGYMKKQPKGRLKYFLLGVVCTVIVAVCVRWLMM